MTKKLYLRIAAIMACGYWLISLFVGSRPALPFLPFGAFALAVIATGLIAAYAGGSLGVRKKPAFLILTMCCLIYGAFMGAEIYLHVTKADGYYVRPLLMLPLIVFAWYGAWRWFFVWAPVPKG